MFILNQKQNEPKSIQRLAAQRYLYSKAKQNRNWQVILAVASATSIFVIYFFPSTEVYWTLFTGIVVTVFNEGILAVSKQKLISKAAAIQEKFDTTIFEISWNEGLVDKNDVPSDEEIGDYAKKIKDYEPFKNWYPFKENVEPNRAVLIAQRSNLVWDRRQRKFYHRILVLAFTLLLAVPLLFSAFQHLLLSTGKPIIVIDYLIKFLAATLPLLLLWYKSMQGQQKIMEEQLTKEKEIEALLQTTDAAISKDKLRHFQDAIYKNRATGEPVPDFIYNHYRSSYDTQMHDAAQSLTQS